MNELRRIIDHFTDQKNVQVFTGFGSAGLGQSSVNTTPDDLKRRYTTELGDSPLSFAHNDDADHEGPMQRGCPSCFLIQAARKLPSLNKAEAKALIKEMRQAVASFGDENPVATEEIIDILLRAESTVHEVITGGV